MAPEAIRPKESVIYKFLYAYIEVSHEIEIEME